MESGAISNATTGSPSRFVPLRETDSEIEADTNNPDSPPDSMLPKATAVSPPCYTVVARLFRFDPLSHPTEAVGLAMDIFGRGTAMMASMFLGPALLGLTRQAAAVHGGCLLLHGEEFDDCVSHTRLLFGTMKASSVLSNLAMASGLASSVFMPLFGAIMDHTPHRRSMGAWSAALLSITKGVEALLLQRQSWLWLVVLQWFTGICYNLHICATYAYTSELSESPAQQTRYNTHMMVTMYVSSLIFLISVMGLSHVLNSGDDENDEDQEDSSDSTKSDVLTARVSQTITFLFTAVMFSYAWAFLFSERPALRPLSNTSCASLCRAALSKLKHTCTHVLSSELPFLRYFYISVAFNEAATGALVTIATTILSVLLKMSSTQIGVVFLIVLLMGIPGSKLGEAVAFRCQDNPLASLKICMSLFGISTLCASFILVGPEAQGWVWPFCVVWGLLLGWYMPVQTATLCTVIPPSTSSAEYMGLYIFGTQILAWMPPLIFTVLNESPHIPMNWGFWSLVTCFFVGLAFLFAMGPYEEAIQKAKQHGRLQRQHLQSNHHEDNGGLTTEETHDGNENFLKEFTEIASDGVGSNARRTSAGRHSQSHQFASFRDYASVDDDNSDNNLRSSSKEII